MLSELTRFMSTVRLYGTGGISKVYSTRPKISMVNRFIRKGHQMEGTNGTGIELEKLEINMAINAVQI